VLNPNNQEVLNNLKFAQNRTVDEIKWFQKLGLVNCRDFTAFINDKWAWLAHVLCIILLGFIGYFRQLRTSVFASMFWC
jgi:hypothetical protein